MLAGVKQSVNTKRACPSCTTETSNFNLLCCYDDNDILRTPQKMIDLYNHGKGLIRNRQKKLFEDMSKEYSFNLVSVSCE